MAWNYDTISRTLSEMARENYEDMVKAFLAMELSIKNKSLLDTLYQDFMGIDDLLVCQHFFGHIYKVFLNF